jgi:hypothetical protein
MIAKVVIGKLQKHGITWKVVRVGAILMNLGHMEIKKRQIGS